MIDLVWDFYQVINSFDQEESVRGAIIFGTTEGIPLICRLVIKGESLSDHRNDLNRLFKDLV
ncbi:MAG: hypothetical protein ACFFD4_40290 [Candidatus Odinarchaeota archaeon]